MLKQRKISAKTKKSQGNILNILVNSAELELFIRTKLLKPYFTEIVILSDQ